MLVDSLNPTQQNPPHPIYHLNIPWDSLAFFFNILYAHIPRDGNTNNWKSWKVKDLRKILMDYTLQLLVVVISNDCSIFRINSCRIFIAYRHYVRRANIVVVLSSPTLTVGWVWYLCGCGATMLHRRTKLTHGWRRFCANFASGHV